jgi:hypothetical protein
MPTSRDYQRYARRGTTAQRGYAGLHQAEQKRRLALWRPGDPCARCGHPMWQRWMIVKGRRVSAIHLGHTDDRTAYRGLEHAHCNLSDGATRGNRMRGQRRAITKTAISSTYAVTIPPPLRTSRQW